MNALEKHLQKINPSLYSKFEESKNEVILLLGKYSSNFPSYTDHSSSHTLEVFQIASELLTDEEITNLNGDETYILSMSCLLHDIGMCIPENKIHEITETEDLIEYRNSHPNLTIEEFIRDIHHLLSKKFILHEYENLKIPTFKYAKAIALVSAGHRKEDLSNFEIYEPSYFAKSGKEFSCLPYLSSVLRIADELDITNTRTPRILTKYYMPNNEVSKMEWAKHIATSQRNYLGNKVIFEVSCTDQNIYAALQEQFEKIQNVINYCQKTIRAIPYIKDRLYSLNLSLVEVKYDFIGFDPKGIKFSFDVQNVVNAFIGEDLYKDKMTSVREAIQNSIDSCRYKSKVLKENYSPQIKITFSEKSLKIEDNGSGMDLFIIENFFGRLASSFYEQDKIKTQFEAIGQFGVGVFSYFLLSEYIDIETKTSTSSAIKFRFDKDPKSYFHFYDKANRTDSGTTITMNFKENFGLNINFNMIETYIRRIFKHVEIPIEISDGQINSIVYAKPFEIIVPKEIRERLKLQHRNLEKNLKIVDCKINCDEFEGICGIIVGSNYLNTFDYNESFFDSELFYSIDAHRSHSSQVSISQKSVFVNFYQTAALSLIIGDINLKKKLRINIDRNAFTEVKEIYKIVSHFELGILKKIFEELNSKYKSEQEKLTISNSFLKNYVGYIAQLEILSAEFINVICENVFIKYYMGDVFFIENIKKIVSSFPEVIFISELENAEEIFKFFKVPILIANGTYFKSTYDPLIQLFVNRLGFNLGIHYHDKKGYDFLTKKEVDKNFKASIKNIRNYFGKYNEIVSSNSKGILVSSWQNKDELKEQYLTDSMHINYNHWFIQILINNHLKIIENPLYIKCIKSVNNLVYEMQQDSEILPYKSIEDLNNIIVPLEDLAGFQNFTLDDFK